MRSTYKCIPCPPLLLLQCLKALYARPATADPFLSPYFTRDTRPASFGSGGEGAVERVTCNVGIADGLRVIAESNDGAGVARDFRYETDLNAFGLKG